MTIRVSWNENPEDDILKYIVERSDTSIIGPYSKIAETTETYILDVAGTVDSFYRIAAVDQANQQSDFSTPFQASLADAESELPAVVYLDHNTGAIDNLRYIGPGGTPVEAATISVFKKIDYDAGNTETPLGTTKTRADGRWQNSVPVEIGITYVVQFFKQEAFGPDTAEVVV